MAKTKTAPKTKAKVKPAVKKTATTRKTTKVVKRSTPKRAASTTTAEPSRALTALSYLGVFVLIPLFHPDGRNSFVRFHANQGLALLIVELIVIFGGRLITELFGLFGSLLMSGAWIFIALLIIIGVSNVAQGERKKLPLVGALATALNL